MSDKKPRIKKQYTKKNKANNINSEINNLNEAIQNNMNLLDNHVREPDEDYIRPPDSIIKERLIDYNEDNMDEELMMVINISRRDYYNSIKSNYINIENKQINNNNAINFEDMNIEGTDSLFSEAYAKENTDQEQHDNDELLKVLELSKNEQLKYEEYILNESKELEKTKRKDSLQLFCKKIEKLVFTKEDLLIKKYIESVLEDYFSLKIDYINIDEDMYNKLYSVIDTYYLIPTIKKYKKTAITEIEDNLVRNIFRKQ